MILKIAIADSNEEYVSRILSVLEEYEDLNLSVFTDENTLEQALMSQKFDVLLFDASVYDGHADGGKDFCRFFCWMKHRGVRHNFKRQKRFGNISGSVKYINRYLRYMQRCAVTPEWSPDKRRLL